MEGDMNVKGEVGGFMGHRRVKGAFLITMLLLAAFLLVKVVGEIKAYQYIGAGIPATNTINVSGEGEVFAVPDVATFSFSVIEEKPTVAEAQGIATKKINDAIAYLKQNGIEEKDIKTIGYNVNPQYDYTAALCTQFSCPPGKQTLRGYEVSQTISVKVRNTDDAGKLLAGIGEIGANNISGLEFTIDDDQALIDEARGKAIADARKKATELAKDLKVKLVRVVSFNEFSASPYYARYDMVALGKGGEMAPAPEIPLGENRMVIQVSITYEIR